MPTLEVLRKQARDAGEAISKIETEKRRKAHAKLVGRSYRYRNSYSCPEKPSDYWWMYTKVTSMDDDGYLRGLQFQVDRDGNIMIEFAHYLYHHLNGGYEPIKTVEFDRAWEAMVEKIISTPNR